MKKVLFVLIWLSVLLPNVVAQIIMKRPLSERQTGYDINASLDPVAKKVIGDMKAFWVNKSYDTVRFVEMHLYMNAFRNDNSTLNMERRGSNDRKVTDYGRIDVNSITDNEGNDLMSDMQFISPDDNNNEDMTVLKIDLRKPASLGDTVALKIRFELKLPGKINRTGYSGDYFFVAQWFPKFGVYEPAGMRYSTKGAWNCHQFHLNSEFYSNHSVYDVRITLPKTYVVGTCGLLIDEKDKAEGIKTLTYRAEDIVDFAWTAWPGYAVYTDQWKDVRITLLSPPERKNQVTRQFQAVKNALEYLDANVGPYPWPYLTFVDPPAKGEGAGGMEYTTLFTSESFYGVPGFLHLPEMVTIHEFGHAYFMGILASNEFEEPWLDEGVNTFWEGRIVDHYYGKNSGLIDNEFFKLADQSMARLSYVGSGSRQTVSNSEYSWNYPHGTYGMMSYNKTAVILNTLMGIVGEETTNEIFREYYRRWAFKYPSGRDFIKVANEVVERMHVNKFGTDMNWFFNETLYGTGICDYKVSDFRNEEVLKKGEYLDDKDSLAGVMTGSDSIYKSVVELERAGDIILPEEVLVHFSDGEEIKELWDGKSRFRDFNYTGKRTIQWVKIDPDYKIKMDVNYINNSMTEIPDRAPVRRLSDKLISFMQFFISFVSL